MRKEFMAVFSGFPDHHFSVEITERLRAELTRRKSIVFITACPFEYEQNDDDCDGMHEMFAEQGLPFEKHCVIDKRTEPSLAKELVENADCIWLMGGGVCKEQLDLIREKGCYEALLHCHAAILGVSAGSMNMAKTTVDFLDSMEPYEGLGFTDFTVSCHHDPEDKWRLEQTLRMSEDRVVYAMEDMSAFFIKEGKVDIVGKIYRAENRELRLLTDGSRSSDVSYVSGRSKFNYRVCGIMIRGGKVLAMHDERSPYYYLPGGRVKMGETAEHAVVREIEEELGVTPRVIRPLWLNQGFFTEDVDQLDYHELCIYFLLDVSGTDLPERGEKFTLHERHHTLEFEWLSFERLKTEYFYPVFLKTEIDSLPESFTLRTEFE